MVDLGLGGDALTVPVEIAWHNMDSAARVEARIEQRAERLQRIMDRISHITVVVEASHRRHHKGNEYEVRLDVGVPGSNLTVNRHPGNNAAHADLLVTVRDAFDAMERQLKRWVEQHGGRPTVHEAPLQGRVTELDAEAGSGQIAATDGRLVYFHRNSVVTGDFDQMSIGDTVELVVDPGEDAAGAHASTVRSISSAAFIDKPG